MLILPAERKLDWKRPPWITLALIVANILVFTVYQSNDNELIDKALAKYQQERLLVLELPVYETYLSRQANLYDDETALEQLTAVQEAVAAGEEQMLRYAIIADRAFYAYALENSGRHWQPGDQARWRVVRQEIQSRYLDSLSSLRFGLKPYDVQVADLIVYQFLHGGWGHLIGAQGVNGAEMGEDGAVAGDVENDA